MQRLDENDKNLAANARMHLSLLFTLYSLHITQ